MPLLPIPDPPGIATRPWHGSDRTLPAYRFVPGLYPHPTRSPAGHGYRRAAEVHPVWSPEEWRGLETYLRGVDLFNRWYFWEAHEAWEGLWKAHPADAEPARFMQGLIASAAMLLKLHMGQTRAACTLARSVDKRWTRFCGIWMGIDVEPFRADCHRSLVPFDEGTSPSLGPRTPVILLADSSKRDRRAPARTRAC